MASMGQGDHVQKSQEMLWLTPNLRMNDFQRMMIEWDRIHPYNAVHAVALAGRTNVLALRGAVLRACAAAGVGELVVDRKHRTYRYRSIEDIQIHQNPVPEGRNAEQTLHTIICEEMNKPFPTQPHFPLRWIVFDDSANDEHFLVLAYHHVAADANSIQSLLALVLLQYLDLPPAEDSELPTTISNQRNLPSRGSRRGANVRSLARAVQQTFRLRHAHRMHESRGGRSETSFLVKSMPDGSLNRLRNICRAEGASLNDVFLAALASAIALMTPARRTHRHRRKIALATVFSHRKWAKEDPSHPLGVCLSEAAVLIDQPDAGVRETLAQVLPQTRRRKSPHGAPGLSWKFWFVKYIWPALRIPNSVMSYRKVFPLCAGVSTVSVNETSSGEAMRRVQRYVRACPPGPAMPLLLSPTACAGRLELGFVFRQACLTEAQARALLDSVVSLLGEFAARVH